jgi:hypothetical protein
MSSSFNVLKTYLIQDGQMIAIHAEYRVSPHNIDPSILQYVLEEVWGL